VQTKTVFWVAAVRKTIKNCQSPHSPVTPGPGTTTVAGGFASHQRAELFVISALLLLLPVMKLIVGRD